MKYPGRCAMGFAQAKANFKVLMMKISALYGLLSSKGKLHIRGKATFGSLWTECLVECMPNTRRSGHPLLPINPEPQLIGRMDAQRDIERRAAQQEQARLAALAAAQVHQHNIDNPGLAALAAAQVHQHNINNLGRATNLDDEDLGDDELLNPRRADEVAAPMNRRDRQARMRPEHRAVQVPFDNDDDLVGASATGAIIPPPLAPGAKFNITSTMIQLLQLKGLFGGLAGDDPNMHLINFISTCKAFDNLGVGQNAIRLRLFYIVSIWRGNSIVERANS
ncbi:hypothetical protein CQW23_13501 [Capsicum baccatum]|uniref:Uncharacterized protein n=1 Tax=Capsicum baccatum TaxID=33114 RepID=A0A2G2WVM9_CAPBA|nr:hypothetical protein CQW23_13501 [Capsicum baccatum]